MSITFDIKHPDEALRPALQSKIDNLTKPKGSLRCLLHHLRVVFLPVDNDSIPLSWINKV